MKNWFNWFITILVMAVASFASAKDLATLEKEFLALGGDRTAEKAYVETNKADVALAFVDWAKTDDAKKSVNIWEQKNGKRRMFCLYTVYNYSDVRGIQPLALINVDCWRIKEIMAADNPTFYDELKANDFVLGGVKITDFKTDWLAFRFGDYDYIASKGIEHIVGRIKSTPKDTEVLLAYITARTPVWLKGGTDAETELVGLRNALIQYNGNESLLDKVNKILTIVRADAITGTLKK